VPPSIFTSITIQENGTAANPVIASSSFLVTNENNYSVLVQSVPSSELTISGLEDVVVPANESESVPFNVSVNFVGTVSGSINVTIGPEVPNNESNQSTIVDVTVISEAHVNTSSIKLRISDLDVKIDGGTDKNIEDEADGYEISKEARPGSYVEFEIEIENLYTDEEDVDINDIEIEITIEDIDDGDDLDEETDEFDLRPEDDTTETLSFRIPLLVDDETFDVIIEVEGRDENGINHRIVKNFVLEVEKERHDVQITRFTLNPSTVSCERTAFLDVRVLNLGKDDEDNVRLEISNGDLGLNFVDEFELENGDDEDAVYDREVVLSLEDAKRGSYVIDIRSYYDNRESDNDRATLVVEKCVVPVKKEEEVRVIFVDTSDGQPSRGVRIERPSTSLTWVVAGSVVLGGLLVLLLVVLLVRR